MAAINNHRIQRLGRSYGGRIVAGALTMRRALQASYKQANRVDPPASTTKV